MCPDGNAETIVRVSGGSVGKLAAGCSRLGLNFVAKTKKIVMGST